jgi:hypothetical protein
MTSISLSGRKSSRRTEPNNENSRIRHLRQNREICWRSMGMCGWAFTLRRSIARLVLLETKRIIASLSGRESVSHRGTKKAQRVAAPIPAELERLAAFQFGQRLEERLEIPPLAEHPLPIIAPVMPWLISPSSTGLSGCGIAPVYVAPDTVFKK